MDVRKATSAGQRARLPLNMRPSLGFLALLLLGVTAVTAWWQAPSAYPVRHDATVLEWLTTPVERNAPLRLPALPSSLTSVTVVAADKAWAVGLGGSIMSTSDAGKTWKPHRPVVAANLRSVSFQPDGQRGWIVGDGGTILSTDNAGVDWKAQSLNPGSEGLIDLVSVEVNPRTGQVWAVSGSGALISGEGKREVASWTRSNIQHADVSAVYFSADGMNGWVTARGAIFFTQNQGLLWSESSIGLPPATSANQAPQFKALWFVGRYGWAVGENGTIVSSSNYGRSWSTPHVTRTQATLNTITGSAEGLWAAGDQGTLLFSADGFTWNAVDSGTYADLRSLSFFGPLRQDFSTRAYRPPSPGPKRHRLMCDGRNFPGNNPFAVPSPADSAQSVMPPIPEPMAPEPADLQLDRNLLAQAVRSGAGIAVGDAGTVITGASSGATSWGPVASAAHMLLRSVQVSADGKTVVAVGESGAILSSTNGGSSWDSSTPIAHNRLNGLSLLDNGTRAWAVGDNGKILASADAGASWRSQPSPTQSDLLQIDFAQNGSVGVAVGRNQSLLFTRDGGTTWQQARLQKANDKTPIPEGGTFKAVHLDADGARAWAVGDQGLIASSEDAGETWRVISMLPSPLTMSSDTGLEALAMNLSAIEFLADGRTGWVAGDNGMIAKTLDGGDLWRVKHRLAGLSLTDLHMHKDGRQGWVSANGGLILATQDGGETWSPAQSAAGSTRLALAMDQSGKTGWAVGYPPALLHTTDNGHTWKALNWPLRHGQYPAPWFWFAVALCALLVWLMFNSGATENETGAAAIAATDAPTEDSDKDSLGVSPLARGISRFLRNTRTEPPLTLAISGGWGSGKSSLMALICQDLRRYKYRPVWFNAWHHQSEEQLLAALFNAICKQGLPSLLSLDGWAFRLQLLWIRSRRHLVLALVLIASASCLVGYLLTHNLDEWTNLWVSIQSLIAREGKAQPLSGGDIGKLFGQLATGVVTFKSLFASMTAFGVSPATLLSSTASRFSTSTAQNQTSFRTTFANQFSEVTQALPYRTVIVIDDLDRCRPEIILTIMEAVNFLVTSGSCFVIFGMDTCYIRTALGLHFEKFADELALRQKRDRPDDPEPSAAERRWNYAGNYLEKLVNLEIQVPQHKDLSPLLRSTPGDNAQTQSFIRKSVHFWPFYLFALVITLGFAAGKFVQLPSAQAPGPTPSAKVAPLQQPPAPSLTAPSSPAPGAALSSPAPVANDSATPITLRELQIQESTAHPLAIWSLAAALLLFVLFSCSLGLYRLRTSMRQVNDSGAFNDALSVWLPVVRRRHTTPRAIKRFINRIRYLAMLQQGEKLDRSLIDELLKRPPGTYQSRSQAVSEHRLVALGALHELYNEAWRETVKACPSDISRVIDDYRSRTQSKWPPGDAELDAFESSLQGVRVAGEVDVLSSADNTASPHASQKA